jgi:hypothetical protein
MIDIKTYMSEWSLYYDYGIRDAVKGTAAANQFKCYDDGSMCGYGNGYASILERYKGRVYALHWLEQWLRECKQHRI